MTATLLRFHDAPELLALSGALARPPADAVDVWGWSLDADAASREVAVARLTGDERERMARFTQPRDRGRYAIAHAAMRTLLARYVGGEPAAVPIVQPRGGRPALSAGGLEFNLTHCAGRALLAVATAPVGVDLECEDATLDAQAVADRYFHGEERAAIRAAPPAQRNGVFLRHWVAKEAVLKAQGEGLALPLDLFAVAPDSQGRFAGVISHDAKRVAPDWRVEYLPTEGGWHAGVAARGAAWRVRLGNLRERAGAAHVADARNGAR